VRLECGRGRKAHPLSQRRQRRGIEETPALHLRRVWRIVTLPPRIHALEAPRASHAVCQLSPASLNSARQLTLGEPARELINEVWNRQHDNRKTHMVPIDPA